MNDQIRYVTLLESDLPKLIFAGQLSKRTSFQIRVDGPFEAHEQTAVRAMLDAQLAILQEPSPAASSLSPGAPEPDNPAGGI
jgi:hypothetical protein